MANHRIYQYSSIARPLHWYFPTNRAVLILLPIAFLSGVIKAMLDGGDIVASLDLGVRLLLAVFGCWALARELNPDDHAAAFLSLLFGWLVAWVMAGPGLLLLFVSLVLVRLVNRSTGLAARLSDSILACLLVFWVIYGLASPQFGLVAALAYALDGLLREPQRRQWIFALVCLGGVLVYLVDHDQWLGLPAPPGSLYQWMSLLFLVMFALNILLLRHVRSNGDFAGLPLDPGRVRAGMVIGLLATLQSLGDPANAALPVAVIAGVSVGLAFRKAFSAPAGG